MKKIRVILGIAMLLGIFGCQNETPQKTEETSMEIFHKMETASYKVNDLTKKELDTQLSLGFLSVGKDWKYCNIDHIMKGGLKTPGLEDTLVAGFWVNIGETDTEPVFFIHKAITLTADFGNKQKRKASKDEPMVMLKAPNGFVPTNMATIAQMPDKEIIELSVTGLQPAYLKEPGSRLMDVFQVTITGEAIRIDKELAVHTKIKEGNYVMRIPDTFNEQYMPHFMNGLVYTEDKNQVVGISGLFIHGGQKHWIVIQPIEKNK